MFNAVFKNPRLRAGNEWVTGAIRMRRTIFFRPLAVILALLMMPPEWGNLSLATQAQAATFPVQAGCTIQGGSWIIQQVCGPNSTTPPGSTTIGAIQQWEQDSIAQYLQLYQLSNTPADVAFVYQYARADLRTAIRGYMQTRMMTMALEDSSLLTANEAAVLSWFRARWSYHEQNLYTNAINSYNSWVKNPCAWKPDPDIAQVVKLNYIACVGSIAINNAPNTDYYLLAGRKSEYETLLANMPILGPSSASPNLRAKHSNGVSAQPTANATSATTPGPSPAGITLFTVSTDQMWAAIGSLLGISALAAAVPAVAKNVPALNNFFSPSSRLGNVSGAREAAQGEEVGDEIEENVSQIATDANGAGDLATAGEADLLAAEETTELASEAEIETEVTLEAGAESAPETFGIGFVAAVAVLLVTLAVTFAVTDVDAVKQVASQLQSAEQQALPGGQVNMKTLLSSTEGLYKYGVVWTEATYPDVPSSSTLPAASASTQFINTPSGQTQPVLGGSFTDWSGNSWTMAFYNGFFINTGAKNVTVDGTTTPITYDSISPSIHFEDWNKKQFTAVLLGTNFVVSKRTVTTSDSFCAPNSVTGLSSTVNSSTCRVQVVNQLQLIDGNGNHATVQIGTAPVFNNPPGQTIYNAGPNYTMQVVATGIPTPTIGGPPGVITVNGQLENEPSGLGFIGTGPGTAEVVCCQYPSTPATPLPPGTYVAGLTATNIVGATNNPFTFAVASSANPLGISQVSGPSGNLYFGAPETWVWQASGAGPYQFYTNMTIGGMTFTDNGNGTAQFIGTPGIGTPECSGLNFCGVWVTNADTQTFLPDANHVFLQFTPQLKYAPAATLTTTSEVFPLGQAASYILTSQGGSTPVSYSTPCGGLPSWLTVTDNGNGTAAITGAPSGLAAANGQQTFSFVLQPTALGSQPPSNPCASPNFTASINSALNIVSPSSASFTVNSAGAFDILSNYPDATVVLDSTLPNGLDFESINGGLNIDGAPSAGTGGDYFIQYHVTNGGTTYTPPALFLTVYEGATLQLPASIYMMAGVPQNFVVVASGYPGLGSTQVRILNASPSTPPGLSGSGDSEITTQAGTYTLAGTIPASAAGNQYTIQFNAVNTTDGQDKTTTITVVPPGDVNHDMVTNCTDYDLVKALLNVTYTSPNYNPAADVNRDGVINILDLAFVSANLPKGTVCH